MSRSAERRTHSQFLRAALGPDQQQIGDVGAGDQQEHSDRRHHHPEAPADVAHKIVGERPKIWA